MSRLLSRRSSPSLSRAVYGFVVLNALLAAAGAWLVVDQRQAELRQIALAEAVRTRAQGIELDFARTLHREWRKARTIAQDIASRDASSVRTSLDLVVGDNSQVSWAGIAALDGTVTVASGGLLEQQNVSSRPWFQRGLTGDFAGDVHKAVLLADLLPSSEGGQRQFLDLATPIKDSQGRVTGVLGLHLDYSWAQAHLAETARALQLDAFIVDRTGTVMMATTDVVERSLDLPSMRAATAGAARAALETWPDGVTYQTAVIPQVGYSDLPSFGWSLVARIDNNAMAASSVSGTLVLFFAGFGLVLAVTTFVFVQAFVRPLQRLASSARSILAGEETYPYEAISTAEARTLSAAVARLQENDSQAPVGS